MDAVAGLAVFIPLVVGAILAAVGRRLPGEAVDAVAVAAAAAVTALCAVLVAAAQDAPVVHWFGGWEPRDDIVLGIAFAVDELGAGIAAFAAFLTSAALLYMWHYFDEAQPLFSGLVLCFLGGMTGFALSGDLFNMFVFFELMSVAGYALTAARIEAPSPLQAAVNFAFTNSIGALLVLFGTALLYGRTGTLNLAAIGEGLGRQPVDGLVIAAFAAVTAGFFVKAAVVPFHFWHADAHAAAPTPICMLFATAMVQLGVYAVARLLWTVFPAVVASDPAAVRMTVVWAGLVTALLGAVMSFAQRHLKRLLAFSTVSHTGLFLVGVGLLDPVGLAGSATYVLAHGGVKGGLFLAVGLLLHRYDTVDEHDLRGQGRSQPLAAGVFVAGGLALAGLPLLGPFFGKSLIDEAALNLGYEIVPAVMVVVSALTGGAVLRAAGRVFLGWGRSHDEAEEAPTGGDAEGREEETPGRTPAILLFPAVVLAVLGAGLGLAPGLTHGLERAAFRFQDTATYRDAIFSEASYPAHPLPPPHHSGLSTALGAIATVAAVGVAMGALFPDRLPGAVRRGADAVFQPMFDGLRALHSGHLGDYVAWLALGAGLFGVLFTLALA